jgi:hypothetical protein
LQVLQGFLLAHINSRSEELLQQGSELRIGLSQFGYEFLFFFFGFIHASVLQSAMGETFLKNFSLDWQRRKKYPILVFKYRERLG